CAGPKRVSGADAAQSAGILRNYDAGARADWDGCGMAPKLPVPGRRDETMRHRSRISYHALWMALFSVAAVVPAFGQSAVITPAPLDIAVQPQQEPGVATPGELGFRLQEYLLACVGGDRDVQHT